MVVVSRASHKSLLHLAYRLFNGLYDFIVPCATAQVALQSSDDLLAGRVGDFFQQLGAGHDKAGRAVAALDGSFVNKRLLHRVECLALGQPFHQVDSPEGA